MAATASEEEEEEEEVGVGVNRRCFRWCLMMILQWQQ
jgi:hypothetical protein